MRVQRRPDGLLRFALSSRGLCSNCLCVTAHPRPCLEGSRPCWAAMAQPRFSGAGAPAQQVAGGFLGWSSARSLLGLPSFPSPGLGQTLGWPVEGSGAQCCSAGQGPGQVLGAVAETVQAGALRPLGPAAGWQSRRPQGSRPGQVTGEVSGRGLSVSPPPTGWALAWCPAV